MCGRYASSAGSVDLSAVFGAVDETDGVLAPDYNIAPTDAVPIVRQAPAEASASPAGVTQPGTSPAGDPTDRRRVLSVARGGLNPSWAKHPRDAARLINARSETVASSRMFAQSFARRRCLVPADGWYEWAKLDGARKQPYYLTRSGGGVLGFAGVWSIWRSGDEQRLTCSVLTTAAVGDLAMVHDRMPLLLPAERWAGWLDHDRPPEIESLLAPVPDELVASIELRPVGPEVGDVRNDGPQLRQRVSAPPLGRPRDEPADLTLF